MKTVAFALFLLLAPASADPMELPLVAQLEEADESDGGLGLAESLLSQQEYEGAERLANRVLEEEPNNQRALVVLCKVAVATQETKKARAYADRLLELDDSVAIHHALSAMASMFEGKPELSAASFQRALELGKDQETESQMAFFANSAVLALHQAEKPEKALELCLKYLEEYPKEGFLYLTCSRLYREAESYKEALEVAEKGLEQCPDFHSLHASVALAHANLGNREASEAAFEKLSFYKPELSKELRDVLDGIREDKAEYDVQVR